ncbi:MAG: hypothetical protein G01um10143_301 [Parcubacteria group bacterium Gr01-1014_3]|nr:MAG: hypothetical protein G01um10143_301 [Parcubacteria group bacterium Gr01-1014_3]
MITATIWAFAIGAWLSVILGTASMILIIRSWIRRQFYLAEEGGLIEKIENRGLVTIIEIKTEKETKEYTLSHVVATSVKRGDRVKKGDQLCVIGDNGQTMGFCPDSLRIAKPLAIFLLSAVIIIVAIGYLIDPRFYERKNFVDKLYQQALGPYLIWSVVQEGLLNGYFSNRIGQLVKSEWKSALIVGLFFAFLHLPNPVLTIGTFFWASTSCYLFLKYSRNAYLLGFAHSILGTAIKFMIAAPLIGSGCMRVGPGFWWK